MRSRVDCGFVCHSKRPVHPRSAPVDRFVAPSTPSSLRLPAPSLWPEPFHSCLLRPCCGEFLCTVPCENGFRFFRIGAMPCLECIYPVGCCMADSKAYRCEAGLDSRRRLLLSMTLLLRERCSTPCCSRRTCLFRRPVLLQLSCCPRKNNGRVFFGLLLERRVWCSKTAAALPRRYGVTKLRRRHGLSLVAPFSSSS